MQPPRESRPAQSTPTLDALSRELPKESTPGILPASNRSQDTRTERLLKAQLATSIAQLIERNGWTQVQTAERTAMGEPTVSRLLRGQLSDFSADRLFEFIRRLGHN